MITGQQRIMIMAGGTGGHVFPALAVAEQLRSTGVDVIWLGTQRGIESRVVPEAGIELVTIPISGLRGKGILGWVLAPLRISYAIIMAVRIIIKWRPQALLGMGGFVTGPGGIAGWLLRKPILIHEQNAVAGMTNRILARFAKVVMEAFPGTFAANYCARQTGNPVRADIMAIAEPDKRYSEREGALRVLIVGGSLGASVLNKTVPAAVKEFANHDIEIWHQTGRYELEETQQAYAASTNLDTKVTAFILDMSEAYQWADLVICRAGALTVTELASVGVASILIPFPHAVDDHQTANARFLEHAGASILIQQDRFNAVWLSERLNEFVNRRERLLAMAQAARSQARNNATNDVSQLCMQAIRGAL